jgi:hypothetical protein
MVVFAFSPNPSGYVVSSGNSTAWSALIAHFLKLHKISEAGFVRQSCPDSLQEKIKITHGQNQIVEALSIGGDNDWFLNTDKMVGA